MERKCKKCGIEKEIQKFLKSKELKSGYRYTCLDCENKRCRLKRAKDPQKDNARIRELHRKRREEDPLYYSKRYLKYKITTKQAITKYEKKNRKIKNCHLKLGRAVKTGKIVKPNICSACDKINERIEAHHDDYDRPYEVRWLCKRCHQIADKWRKKRDECKAALQGLP